MGRINAVLDEEVDYGFEGGPRYKNNVSDLENGFEDIDSAWKYPRHEYSASFTNIKDEVRDYIISVYHACRGRRHAFLFKDWNDYRVDGQVIHVEPGTANTIQLYKQYDFGQAYTIRPIHALKSATILDANNDPVPGTFDMLTGEFTPEGMWGSGVYRLFCEFYVWVRFDLDYNPITISNWRNHGTSVDLVEVKTEIRATNLPMSWEE